MSLRMQHIWVLVNLSKQTEFHCDPTSQSLYSAFEKDSHIVDELYSKLSYAAVYNEWLVCFPVTVGILRPNIAGL